MIIDSTTNVPTGTSAADTAARLPQKTLGQADFLKLITLQLSKQDPLKPMEDTDFIAQMAQFTSLQQSTELVSQLGLMRSSTNLASASALIGRTVTVVAPDKSTVTGKVDAVDTAGREPLLVIGNATYSLSSLKLVQPTPVPAAAN